MERSNGWDKYEIHVLESLKRIEDNIEDLQKSQIRHHEMDIRAHDKMNAEIGKLKIKSGLFASVSGVLGGLLAVFGKDIIGPR